MLVPSLLSTLPMACSRPSASSDCTKLSCFVDVRSVLQRHTSEISTSDEKQWGVCHQRGSHTLLLKELAQMGDRRRAHIGVMFGEQDSVIVPEGLSNGRRYSQPCQQEVTLLQDALCLVMV